ncbi:DUF3054 domain-containing protein [Kocuria tytonicola]|uniref:DUF3054 domain-containing protein n=1 Tax=Kocuria tytonicola TaxID=2055946 RepID=A0A3L9L9B0_9MICC|nr:DUF3054 domain-containing protein [Kocuria tytonicola]RLY94948.1 DUF3054 domain-containing protein [Kocuria tytonicola]RLZ02839.1 DUF3054 domain-containing protein [Kocuria tytonicola]
MTSASEPSTHPEPTPVAPPASRAVDPVSPERRAARISASRWPIFLVVDLVLVVVFAAIGRASHGEDVAGMLLTAWPFMVGALVGSLACRGANRPAAVIPTGVSVWLCAVVGGMVLRTFTGQGTALAFVVVSIVVLGVLLVGYRLVLAAVLHSRGR